MSYPLEFHQAVRDEIDAAYAWYERLQPGLGDKFFDEVERMQKLIVAHPARFGFSDGDTRAGLLRRFPYAIYYRFSNDRVRILAVYHTARDPSIWQSRT